MGFPCEKCGACCRAVNCDKLNGNLCSIYDTRPEICQVDAVADARGIGRRTHYAMSKQACHILRGGV